MTYWRRNFNAQILASGGNYWNDAIVNGNTYLRVHIRWGFHIDSPTTVNLSHLASTLVTFGLVTTIGNGSESPVNPQDVSFDPDPPTERFIYWETLAPICQGIDDASGVVIWGNSAQTEPTQTKGQVLATGIPGGDTLNLWATWATSVDIADEFGANATIWHSLSILRKNNGL
jgi:hypothetical protein